MTWKRRGYIVGLLLAFGGCCLLVATGVVTRPLYYTWQGDVAIGETQYRDAIHYYTTAIDTAVIEAWKTQAYRKRADGYIKLSEYDKAIDDLTVVVAQDSSNSTAYYNRGVAYATTGDSQRAIDDLTKAIELEPNETFAYLSRGLAYLTMEQPEKAVEDFTKCLTFDDSLTLVYLLRGYAFEDTGDYDQALADFEETVVRSEDAELAAIARMDKLRIEVQEHLDEIEAISNVLGALGDAVAEIETEEEFDRVWDRAEADLNRIEEEIDTILDKMQEAKELPLPGWYQVYLSKVEESFQLEREGIQLVNQAMQKMDEIVEVVFRAISDLEDVESSTLFSEQQFDEWTAAVEEGRYQDATQITLGMREELGQYQAVFSGAYRESGIETFQTAAELFDKMDHLVQLMGDAAQAMKDNDSVALEKALTEMLLIEGDIEAKVAALEFFDLQLDRWFDENLTPLLEQSEDKFEEMERLEEEADTFFEANQQPDEYFQDLFVDTTE
jgi:tetratricopeptide (TPR) repeat protein